MKKFVLFASVLLVTSSIIAQKLAVPFAGASHKKTTYVTLDDGTEIQGNIKDLDYKKGLIEEIKLKDLKGKKIKIKPEQIKHMYLPISGLAKYNNLGSVVYDATKWASTDIKNDILDKGYVYFEKSEVKIKKKTKVLMLQLMNPTFGSKIKIYNDPFAKETASLGIGGVKVAGGIAKSYYVKKGDKPAYKLKKKDYDEEFKLFYSDCKTLLDKYGASPKWKEFVTHVFEYTKDCK